MNKDFEHIKEIFDNDGIKAPESLSEDKILEMLPDLEETQSAETEFVTVKPKRSHLKRYIALAACAVIALAGIPQLYNVLNGPPDTDLVNGELRTFENYNEIKRLLKDMDDYDSGGFKLFRMGRGSDMAVNESATEDAVEDSVDSGATYGVKSAAGDHSETYLQVEEVDEADIVKTDGNYIYFVNENEEVVILSAKDGKTKKLSVIGNTGVENYIHDIFLKGNTLVTIGVVYDDDEGSSAIVTYDISDRSKPEMISQFKQSGNIISSRMVGDYVYLVTNQYVYQDGPVVPKCTIDGAFADLPANDICCVPQPKQSSYVILSAFDITSGKSAKSKTKAVFGASSTIYCNDHNLYTAVSEWDKDSTYTRILRAGLDGLKIRFNATAKVRGYVDDQFSMNEKDGSFFIATTSQRDGMDVNNLFVLDGNLKEQGKVTGFARNESIRSVRYIGDKAYVITYEQIDPLFIIDISDPAAPRIEGEVKIDGFSTLLVPVSEGKLLGIGYATGDNGYGGEFANGLKLALFDISDPSEPKVTDSKEFKDMDSPAQETHLALTVNKKDGWYAIPYSIYNYNDEAIEESEEESGEESGMEGGVLVFGADDKIKVLDQHKLGSEYLSRCVYIGDYIYALNGSGEASSFQVK
ncbi:MAG: beta-propeller domain-containing protein [Mogibacterium sp.]|nr:beta-propeller domain-containing protein [Mogibacterium sp.]